MKNTVYIHAAVVILMSAALVFGVITPHLEKRQETKMGLTSAEGRLLDYQRTLALLPQYMERIDQLRETKNRLNSRLYAKQDILELFDGISRQAASHRLVISEITPPIEELLELNRMTADSGQPQFLTVGLRIEGDFIDFGQFVGEMEQSDYFRAITRCQVTGDRTGSAGTTMYVRFRALIGKLGA